MPPRLVRAFPLLVVLAATSVSHAAPIAQPAAPAIAGAWVLNPALTQRPQEIGFTPDWARAQGSGGEGGRSGGGRRGGSGSGGGVGVPGIVRQSADDSTRVQQLTGEARTPPSRLTIVQKDAAISIADDQGHARTFRPDGHLEELTIGTVALPTTARWDGASLVVVYDVETGRQLRYTYTPSADPTRLQVNIRFLERGREGDEVRLTYEPPGEHERAILSGAPTSPARRPPASAARRSGRRAAVCASSRAASRVGVARSDHDRHGRRGSERARQGVRARSGEDQDLDRAHPGGCRFQDRALRQRRHLSLAQRGDEQAAGRPCVSRYDASLVTQADATFPYLKGLVAVQVQLLHEGGMAGGSPAAHASAVMDALVKSANSFVSQIRAANKPLGADTIVQ
jgi:hypothetical protein